MGCGCGKKQQPAQQQFVHTSPLGRQTTYRTEVEARAAQIRQGGTYKAVTK